MTDRVAAHRLGSALIRAGVLLALSGCLAFHPERLPGTPEDATLARVGDAQLHYVDTPGDPRRPTLVLLHGFGASINEWALVRPPLERAGFRVVAVDLKGHGWSTRPDGDYSIRAHAAEVVTLLESLGLRRWILVGHSWGSAVALAVALQAPERAERVVLLNGMLFDDQQPTIFHWSRLAGLGELLFGVFYTERLDEKMEHSVYDKDAVTQEAVDRLEELWSRPGAKAAALATVRAIDYADLEARYGDLRQPVLLLWGREDRVTPLYYGEQALKRLPHARLVVLPQCGHAPNVEAWRVVVDRLLSFAGAVQSAEGAP